MNVLVVDDLPRNVEVMRAMLESDELTVFGASDGIEALAVLEQAPIDVVVSDILMPRMDGYRLCQEVRRHPNFRYLPFIFYTGTYTSGHDEKFSLEVGADRFLKKPASRNVLLGMLKEVTAGPRPLLPLAVEPVAALELMKKYTQRLAGKLEQKNEALLESQRRLSALVHSLEGIVWEANPDHPFGITFISQQAERLLGYPVERWLDQPDFWLKVVHPEDRERVQAGRARLATGLDAYEVEYRVQSADGRAVWIHESISVLRDAGHASKLCGIATDITARKRTEEALRDLLATLERRVEQRTAELTEANQQLEAFSYSISHDLRAPLRAIDGFSRILIEDHTERLDDEGRRVLNVVRSEAQRMSRLVDELLAFSRLGRQQLRLEPIDMTSLARSAFSEATAGVSTRRCEFELAPLPPAEGDAVLLRQVFVNLLANAVKFTGPRPLPQISVSGDSTPEENTYYVRDNGVGFDLRHAKRLFGVFQRLHGDEFEGTGVGLAIVERVVHRHGGRVGAEAKPDEGATFYFTLPNLSQPTSNA